MRNNPRYRLAILAAILLLFPAVRLIAEDIEIGADFTIGVDDDWDLVEVPHLEVNFEVDLEFLDSSFIRVQVEATKRDVDVDHLFLDFTTNELVSLSIGKMKNYLTLGEYIPRRKKLIFVDDLVTRNLEYQGYSSRSTGIRVYRKYDKEGPPFSYFSHAFFASNNFEPQLDAGFLYHFDGDDSFLGILGSYYPFFVRAMTFGVRPEFLRISHHFTIDVFIAYLEGPLLWQFEFSAGNNIESSLPGTDTAFGGSGFFSGGTLGVGRDIEVDRITITPAIRYSVLLPDTSNLSGRQEEIRGSASFVIKKRLSIHANGGIEFFMGVRRAIWGFQINARF